MNKRIYLLIFAIAFLILSCDTFKNPVKNSANNSNEKPIVVICIDDGLKQSYEVALPILNKFKYPATFGIITGQVDNYDYNITWAQLDTLQRIYHWEIASHSVSHPHLDLLSEEEFLYQLSHSKITLKEHNFKVDTFIVPYGAMTLKQLNIAKSIYKNIRFAHDNYNGSPFLRYKLWAFELDQSATFEKIRKRIDSAIQKKEKILIFFFHKVKENPQSYFDITPDKLFETLSIIKEKKLQVMTLNNAVDLILQDQEYQKKF